MIFLMLVIIAFFVGFFGSAYLHSKYDEEDFMNVIIVVATILFLIILGFGLGYLVFK